MASSMQICVSVCVCVYLRCQILWGAAERLHGGSVRYALFTKPKVSDLYMAVFVQHQIFQLRNQNEKEARGVMRRREMTSIRPRK